MKKKKRKINFRDVFLVLFLFTQIAYVIVLCVKLKSMNIDCEDVYYSVKQLIREI